MKSFHDGAYALAAYSAVVATMRLLVKNEVVARDDLIRLLLDEAVSRAIAAESREPGEVSGRNAAEFNRQSAEILKMLSQNL